MAKKRRKHPLDLKDGLEELKGMIRNLLTIEGVEGIGQPVTLISPADLPPDMVGFIERLCGGAIEPDEEMLLITLAGSRMCGVWSNLAQERIRQALMLLGRYALDKGSPVKDVLALFDEAKRQLSRSAAKSKG